jgi:hypothetical protein
MEVPDGGKLSPTPWTMSDLDDGRAPVVDHQPEATPHLSNEGVGTVVTARMIRAHLIQVVRHPITA